MDWLKLSDKLEPHLRKGDLDFCMRSVAEALRALPESPFHQVIGLRFTNKPKKIAAYFKQFIRQESKRFSIKAIYTETNGFDINPDRWFFGLCAFDCYGGHEDFDWLCDFQSGSYPSMTLVGMEALQQVYDSDAFYNDKYEQARGYCSLLVVLKFQDLIRQSMPLIKNLTFPVLATSHDYEFIYEYRPDS